MYDSIYDDIDSAELFNEPNSLQNSSSSKNYSINQPQNLEVIDIDDNEKKFNKELVGTSITFPLESMPILESQAQPLGVNCSKNRRKMAKQESDSNEEYNPKEKKIKKTKPIVHEVIVSRKRGYPTKNFLSSAKKVHVQYLKNHLGVQGVNKLNLEQFLGKRYWSMLDFQRIYNMPQLKPTLQQFFYEKVLYRQFLLGRLRKDNKKVYFQKIHVLEQAFKTGEFTHINYNQKTVGKQSNS